jgi:hypothetical protein
MWSTPMGVGGREGKKGTQQSLSTEVVLKNWATPNAADCTGTSGGGQTRSLRTDVRDAGQWGTPTATSTKRSPEYAEGRAMTPQEYAAIAGGQLNPLWVATLMGYSPDWLVNHGLVIATNRSTPGSRREPLQG